MRKWGGIILGGLAGVSLAASSSAQPGQGEARFEGEPVVVELFPAQGCSACPGANRLVEDLAARPGVIALTYAVDYWDYLGWPDTFAKPAFAERQRDYQDRLGLRAVYTPQVIIDGRMQLSGASAPEVTAAIEAEAAARRWPPEVEFRANRSGVGVGSGTAPKGGADVWLVRYEPGAQVVEVRDGENRGLEVRHVNVVRTVERLGDWTGEAAFFALPDEAAGAGGLAVLVQDREDGRILAAEIDAAA